MSGNTYQKLLSTVVVLVDPENLEDVFLMNQTVYTI